MDMTDPKHDRTRAEAYGGDAKEGIAKALGSKEADKHYHPKLMKHVHNAQRHGDVARKASSAANDKVSHLGAAEHHLTALKHATKASLENARVKDDTHRKKLGKALSAQVFHHKGMYTYHRKSAGESHILPLKKYREDVRPMNMATSLMEWANQD